MDATPGHEAVIVGWVNLTLLLGVCAWLMIRDLGLVAALALTPALFAAIARLHVDESEWYAVPVGLYLLAVALVGRRDGDMGRGLVSGAVAALGLLILLGRDRRGAGLVRIQGVRLQAGTLLESLVVLGVGIAVRWRVLVVGGVAGRC